MTDVYLTSPGYPADAALDALTRIAVSLEEHLAELSHAQRTMAEDIERIREAVERRAREEAEAAETAPLDEEEREQANNLIALIRRERSLQSNVRGFFEELIEDSFIDVSDFLSRNAHLPYDIVEDEHGNLTARGLMVAVGRAVAHATGYGAPQSYRLIGYTEDRGDNGQITAHINERITTEVNRII